MRVLTDGLVVGSASLAIGGLAMVLLPGQTGAVVAGSTLGSMGAAIAVRSRKEIIQQEQGAGKQDNTINANLDIPATSSTVNQPSNLPTSKIVTSHSIKSTESTSNTELSEFASESTSQSTEAVVKWLNTRNLEVISYHRSSPIDTIFNNIALSLGKQYDILKPLYGAIKRSAAQGVSSSLNVQGKSQAELSLWTRFCSEMRDKGMLSQYRYDRVKRLIQLNVQPRGDIQNFFTGNWFERYTCQTIIEILKRRKDLYSVLINPRVQLPNGDRFELDLLFLVNDQPLWLECKTGKDSHEHLKKYSNHRRMLAVPTSRSFLVMLEIEQSMAEDLTRLWDMTAVNQQMVIELVEASLG
jgi:hypothetical protein